MSNKVKRTNERCYICDFSREASAGEGNSHAGKIIKDIKSLYYDGLSSDLQEDSGRYVFVHPKDGRPVCNACSKSAEIALADFTADDKVTWHDTNSRLFEKAIYNVPSDLWNPNIDWDKVKPPYTFPLPTKQEIKHMGVQGCTRYQEHPLTEEHKEQVRCLMKSS